MSNEINISVEGSNSEWDSNLGNYSKVYDSWDSEDFVECKACYGTGLDRDEIYECDICGGEGIIVDPRSAL